MSNYKFETLQLHVGQEQPDPASDARAVPIYATTSYVFRNSQHAADRFGLADAGNIYGRLTNSTQRVFEQRIAALEGGVAGLAVASGAAAITYTIQALAAKGEHIVAQKTIYGGTANLLAHTLPLYGIEASLVNIHDLAEVEASIRPNTKAIYVETLGNPSSDIPDIPALAEIAPKHGLPLVLERGPFVIGRQPLFVEHFAFQRQCSTSFDKHPEQTFLHRNGLPLVFEHRTLFIERKPLLVRFVPLQRNGQPFQQQQRPGFRERKVVFGTGTLRRLCRGTARQDRHAGPPAGCSR